MSSFNDPIDTFANVAPELMCCVRPKLDQIATGLQAKSDLITLTVALLKALGLPSVQDGMLGVILTSMKPATPANPDTAAPTVQPTTEETPEAEAVLCGEGGK